MKKVFLVLMAIMMAAVCCTALAEEEPAEEPAVQEAPDPDCFSGIWECDRASIEIVWEEEGYRVLIHWGSSALEATEWEYSCYYYEEDKTMVSLPFGSRTEIVFSEDSDTPAYTEVYNDGVARFFLDEEGYLIWADEKENAGEGMRFKWISEYEMTDETEEATEEAETK